MIVKELKVEGLGCGHCVDAVTKALKALPEVEEVSVDLENQKVTVTFQDSLDELRIAEAIEEAGYRVL